MENLREGTLVGFGNPLLDISVNADEKLLEKYGLKPNDAILADERHKTLYDEISSDKSAQYIAGGSCQNSLRVAQWILRKPRVAVLFGSVGTDDFAKKLAEKARLDGVDVRYQRQENVPTGTCAVLLTHHHRSLCANLAAANKFTIDHIRTPENKKILDAAAYVYATGFFLTSSPETALDAAKQCHAKNTAFLMNLSAPFVSTVHKIELLELLPYVDIIFGNELEAEAFAKEQNWETNDMHQIALKLSEWPKQNDKRERVAIVTQGKDPVLIAQNGKLTEIAVKKLEDDEIVDTNGAGDAFVGGFLAQFIQNKSYDACVKCGIWTAQQIIKRHGCTFEGEPIFNEDE